jgi:stearoyl-CoA desaturase (Delta-9 desaturase)
MRTTGFNWPTGLFLISYHTALLIMLPLYLMYNSPSWAMWGVTIALYFMTGLSITAGYHRYYSHQSYKAHPIIEALLLFFGSMATQGSALRWSFEHRIHHAFVDTDKDPYSINKGFWYAHITWLFHNPDPIDKKVVADLLKNRLVMFQYNYYTTTMVVTNLLAVLTVGWLLDDFAGAFVLCWLTRLFFLHHSTWFINSLAHTWGARTFSKEQTAVDNYLISLVTFGEGYHNYHHTYASDYRNGIRWYHFDPTKWLIWTLNKLGLANSLKRIDPYHVKERIVEEHKAVLLEELNKSNVSGKEELSTSVCELSGSMSEKLARIREILDQNNIRDANDDFVKKSAEIKTLEKGFTSDWQKFRRLYKSIKRERIANV